jgi:hypothetical protein
MTYESQHDETNDSLDPSGEADISMDFTDETTLDDVLYGLPDETHPLPEDAESATPDTESVGQTESQPQQADAFQDNVPDFHESTKHTLTGKEVLLYVCMIGVLSGVAWWITQELKQLGALQAAQARVGINTSLLPTKDTDTPEPSALDVATPDAKKQADAGPVKSGNLKDLLLGLLTPRPAPTTTGGPSADQSRQRHQKLVAELELVSSDSPWMGRAKVLLPIRGGDTLAASSTPEFWEDPLFYGAMRVDQRQRSANNHTGYIPRVEPIGKRFLLSGIMVVDGLPTAVINGRQVRVGNRISDAKVLRIDTFSVTIEVNSEKHTLRL